MSFEVEPACVGPRNASHGKMPDARYFLVEMERGADHSDFALTEVLPARPVPPTIEGSAEVGGSVGDAVEALPSSRTGGGR